MPKIEKQVANGRAKVVSTSSVVNRIAPIEFTGQGLKVLLYGVSGSGKTTTAGTFPGPLLWIICSGGIKPGELRSLDTPDLRKRISQVVLQSTDDLRELLEYLHKEEPYKTVVLDHVSGLQDLDLKEILGLEEIPAQKSWGLATQQQYGQSTQHCKEFLRSLINLSCNVIIIGQERTFGGKEDGGDPDLIKPTVGPAITPSLCGWLAPACDYTMQMFKRPRSEEVKSTVAGKTITQTKRLKGVDYCARCEASEVFMTKFRVPRGYYLPDYIPDPSYTKIQAVINGTYKE